VAARRVDDLAAAAGHATRSFHRKIFGGDSSHAGEAVALVCSELARSLRQTTRLKLAQISREEASARKERCAACSIVSSASRPGRWTYVLEHSGIGDRIARDARPLAPAGERR
jgi:hypothetical protein